MILPFKKLAPFLLFVCFGLSFLFAESKSEKKDPKLEVIAFANCMDHLDGPRYEALGHHSGRKASNDTEGNLYFMSKLSSSRLRCLNDKTGLITTIIGDNRWGSNLGITEGPAAFFPNFVGQPQAGDQSMLLLALTVYGNPLEGEEYGSIYLYSVPNRVYRIFKKDSEGGRWWFKALGKIGGKKLPTTRGEVAKIEETDFSHCRMGVGWLTWEGILYKFDEAEGTVTCLLTPSEYQSKVYELLSKPNVSLRRGLVDIKKAFKKFDRLILSEDGTMYIMHPWREGHVFKISKDLSQFEHIVQSTLEFKGWNIDGPGLDTTWHCGPSFITTSGNTLFLRAIDSVSVRRYHEGRVSFLGQNGDWQELSKKMSKTRGKYPCVAGMGNKPADHGLPYIFIHYPGGNIGNDFRIYKYGPVAFDKPTVGDLNNKKGEL